MNERILQEESTLNIERDEVDILIFYDTLLENIFEFIYIYLSYIFTPAQTGWQEGN